MTASIPNDLDTFFVANRARIEQELFEFLRIPSVSARSEHNADTARAAQWLAGAFGTAGLKAESLETTCTITLGKTDGGFAITGSHLELHARVPGASQEAFDAATQQAKAGCPVSKLYNTTITLSAHLEA